MARAGGINGKFIVRPEEGKGKLESEMSERSRQEWDPKYLVKKLNLQYEVNKVPSKRVKVSEPPGMLTGVSLGGERCGFNLAGEMEWVCGATGISIGFMMYFT